MTTRSALGVRTATLLGGATAVSTGDWFSVPAGKSKRSYQGVVRGTGALTATILIEASNDESNAVAIGTITLSGNDLVTDGGLSDGEWAYVRARVSAITGTGATVNVTMGV